MKSLRQVVVLVAVLGLSNGLAFSHERVVKNLPPVYPPLKPERAIVLTIDDGVVPAVLPRMLDFLKQEKIPAAFFFIGFKAAQHPDLVLRVHQEGHEIGNHTYGHGALCSMMPEKMRNRPDIRCLKGPRAKDIYFDHVKKSSEVIRDITGIWPRFFRPPHWLMEEKAVGIRDMSVPSKKGFCEEYWGGLKRGVPVFPADKVYKEELLCRGYLVQMHDKKITAAIVGGSRDLEVAKSMAIRLREIRDVDTGDYELFAFWQKDPVRARETLVRRVENLLREREKDGVYTHVVTFHELLLSLEAWKVLVPEWKKAGYQFQTIRWAWGI